MAQIVNLLGSFNKGSVRVFRSNGECFSGDFPMTQIMCLLGSFAGGSEFSSIFEETPWDQNHELAASMGGWNFQFS